MQHDNFRSEHTDYQRKRKAGFQAQELEQGRFEFTSDVVPMMRPAYSKCTIK